MGITLATMSLKVVILCCAVVLAVGDRAPVYPRYPSYAAHHPAPEYPTAPPKYSYNYGVVDGYSGANFGHAESRDGYKTEGSYTVNLPDGRKQIVNYIDNGDGLIAEVSYEGEAQYPEYKPAPPKYGYH